MNGLRGGEVPAARPRIALIHATHLAFEPIHAAFAAYWPSAAPFDVLDSSLLSDLEAAGRLEPTMVGRFDRLALYAQRAGSEAVLFTCSAFGKAIEHASTQVDIPVFKPNEAMFDVALRTGERIALLVTSQSAGEMLQAEFEALAHRLGRSALAKVAVVSKAMDALRAGNPEEHNRALAQAAASLDDCDVIMLGQYSAARAAPVVRKAAQAEVLAAPDAAVEALKKRLLREGARRLPAQEIEAEAESFLAAMQGERLADGRARVVRHGHGRNARSRPGLA